MEIVEASPARAATALRSAGLLSEKKKSRDGILPSFGGDDFRSCFAPNLSEIPRGPYRIRTDDPRIANAVL